MIKVLIVEDNALAARMAQQVLKKIHCSSDVAPSAQSTLAALGDQIYDLILMDIGLPDRDGFELVQRIRDLPGFQALPIIALTGHLSADKKASCLQAGMQDMVEKPINLSVAQSLIQTWVLSKVAPQDLVSFDLQEGAELSGGGELSARELIQLLVDSLPEVLSTLTRLHQRQNYPEIANEVHKLYGGLCYVGVPRLREITRRLNNALQDHLELAQIDALLQQFETEAKKIIARWGDVASD